MGSRQSNQLEPEETCCPGCGSDMAYLSGVSAEQLELVSSALKVIRTVRVKKACTRCDCIVEAPAPSRPIDRGIAGPGLLARVLTAKYCEHLNFTSGGESAIPGASITLMLAEPDTQGLRCTGRWN